MTMLDHVKEWLNSVDIKYTEGIQSLNWFLSNKKFYVPNSLNVNLNLHLQH